MSSGSNEQLHQQLEYTLPKHGCHSWWISKIQSDTFDERYAIKLCFKLGKKNATETYGMLQTTFGPSCMNQASVLSGIRDSRKAGSLWGMMRGVGGVRKSIHQSWLAKRLRLGLGLLCWGFYVGSARDSVGRGVHSSNRVSGISSRKMHQSTPPSLSQTIWPRWASRHFITLPIAQALLPVTFGYYLSSRKNFEAVVMRQMRRWKRLWRISLTRSHKRTSMEPSRSCWDGTTSTLQPEAITSKGTRVSCVYYQ